MAAKIHNPQQIRASLVREVEAAEAAGDVERIKTTDAALAAHDEAQAVATRITASRERKAEESEARQLKARRRQKAEAAVALVHAAVDAVRKEAAAYEVAAQATKAREAALSDLENAAQNMGLTDLNFLGLRLAFETDLADRMTSKGIPYFRGQRRNDIPEAVLHPGILNSIHRSLARLLEA